MKPFETNLGNTLVFELMPLAVTQQLKLVKLCTYAVFASNGYSPELTASGTLQGTQKGVHNSSSIVIFSPQPPAAGHPLPAAKQGSR